MKSDRAIARAGSDDGFHYALSEVSAACECDLVMRQVAQALLHSSGVSD